ncbi:hypothetical protein [Nocardia sp. SYP-A9097]|uniref:hypothetical protein n=1 Tax=Nocardia sp. SYP-A9097 TaxID=2663237 RepID=UPI001891B130|nr:hypothetical protein [Nocardia sp. SYP-A9097]
MTAALAIFTEGTGRIGTPLADVIQIIRSALLVVGSQDEGTFLHKCFEETFLRRKQRVYNATQFGYAMIGL